MPDFRDAIRKLERAKHHISDLVSECENFYNTMTTSFYIEDDVIARQRILRVKIKEALPDSFALIIGDAIHNMRAALDHLTWDVLRPFKPVSDKVQFPFCKSKENFESVLKNRQILVASQEIVKKFRKLKPYPGGNDLLYALHRLDITDKHELVVPVISKFCFDVFDLRKFDPTAPKGVREKIAFNVYKDNRLAIWSYDPSIPWKPPLLAEPIDVVAQIAFPSHLPYAGKSVPAVLERMALQVSTTIMRFRN